MQSDQSGIDKKSDEEIHKFIFHVGEDRNQRWRFKTIKSFKPFYICCILHILLSAVVETCMQQTYWKKILVR